MSALDATLRRLTGYRMRRATSAMLTAVTETLEPFGLRRTTFSALTVIGERPGLTQAQLSEALAIERPNMVRIVGDLETAGLVVRDRADGDRRAYALRATEEGRRVGRRALAALARVEAALVEGLDDTEIAAFHRALAVVERNAAEGAHEPSRA